MFERLERYLSFDTAIGANCLEIRSVLPFQTRILQHHVGAVLDSELIIVEFKSGCTEFNTVFIQGAAFYMIPLWTIEKPEA